MEKMIIGPYMKITNIIASDEGHKLERGYAKHFVMPRKSRKFLGRALFSRASQNTNCLVIGIFHHTCSIHMASYSVISSS